METFAWKSDRQWVQGYSAAIDRKKARACSCAATMVSVTIRGLARAPRHAAANDRSRHATHLRVEIWLVGIVGGEGVHLRGQEQAC